MASEEVVNLLRRVHSVISKEDRNPGDYGSDEDGVEERVAPVPEDAFNPDLVDGVAERNPESDEEWDKIFELPIHTNTYERKYANRFERTLGKDYFKKFNRAEYDKMKAAVYEQFIDSESNGSAGLFGISIKLHDKSTRNQADKWFHAFTMEIKPCHAAYCIISVTYKLPNSDRYVEPVDAFYCKSLEDLKTLLANAVSIVRAWRTDKFEKINGIGFWLSNRKYENLDDMKEIRFNSGGDYGRWVYISFNPHAFCRLVNGYPDPWRDDKGTMHENFYNGQYCKTIEDLQAELAKPQPRPGR